MDFYDYYVFEQVGSLLVLALVFALGLGFILLNLIYDYSILVYYVMGMNLVIFLLLAYGFCLLIWLLLLIQTVRLIWVGQSHTPILDGSEKIHYLFICLKFI